MSEDHDARHDDRIARLLTEGPESLSAEEHEELRACPACRSELADLEGTLELLGETAEQGRRVFDLARDPEAAPGDERVGPTLEALLASAEPSPRRSWPLAAALLAASIAAVWLGFLALRTDDAPRDPEVWLGDDRTLRCTAPLGEVEEYGAFEWTGHLDEDEDFRVRVFEDGAAGLGRALLESGSLLEQRWEPGADTRAALPPAIEWEVHVLDEFGVPRRSASARASLR